MKLADLLYDIFWLSNKSDNFQVGGDSGFLTAAHGDDDFDFIALRQYALCKRTARHDFAIALDCDAFSGEIQRCDQIGDIYRMLKNLFGAVDED